MFLPFILSFVLFTNLNCILSFDIIGQTPLFRNTNARYHKSIHSKIDSNVRSILSLFFVFRSVLYRNPQNTPLERYTTDYINYSEYIIRSALSSSNLHCIGTKGPALNKRIILTNPGNVR